MKTSTYKQQCSKKSHRLRPTGQSDKIHLEAGQRRARKQIKAKRRFKLIKSSNVCRSEKDPLFKYKDIRIHERSPFAPQSKPGRCSNSITLNNRNSKPFYTFSCTSKDTEASSNNDAADQLIQDCLSKRKNREFEKLEFLSVEAVGLSHLDNPIIDNLDFSFDEADMEPVSKTPIRDHVLY